MDKKLTPAEIIIAASGLVVFVFSFLDYFGEGPFSVNGWDEFPLFTYGALFGAIAAAQILATRLGGVNLPDRVMGFTWPQVHLVLALFAVLVLLGLFALGDAEIGLIFGLLGSIGMLIGAVMLQQESTGRRPTGPTP